MMNVHPACVISIYEAASAKISFFEQNLYNENIQWLKEIQEEAHKAFGCSSLSLLPKTPGTKRKRLKNIDNELTDSPDKQTSTFVEEGKTKKLKIDDMSTIVESTRIEESIIDNTNSNNTSRMSRSLRPRKKKSAANPVKKSKRIANMSNIKYSENSPFVANTPSPIGNSLKHATSCGSSKTLVCSDSIAETSLSLAVVVSPVNPVQPRVAMLIEQLKLSSKKKPLQDCGHFAKQLDEVKSTLFPVVDEQSVVSESKSRSSSNSTSSTRPCVVFVERLPAARDTSPKSPPVTHVLSTPSELHTSGLMASTPSEKTITYTMVEDVCTPMNTQHDQHAVDDSNDETIEQHTSPKGGKSEVIISKTDKDFNDKMEVDSGVSSDENVAQACHEEQQAKIDEEISCKENVIDKINAEDGRRDTYKVMVREAELGVKASPLRIQPFKEIIREIQIEDQHLTDKNTPNVSVLKPKMGNIVTGIKSFINKPTAEEKKSQQEEEEEKRRKMQVKEMNRGKTVNEAKDRKLKAVELKKKQREDREKRFALQQAKLVEEEERRRKQLEQKSLQVKKNQEEIKKQKEEEEKKKRAIREMKQNDAGSRRLREEEEHRRKVCEQIEEEERRREMLQRKAEYEEQQRLKKKKETEKAEKERLKQIEDERLLCEERKKREFEEKEKYRLKVEKKLKEEKEKERIEKQQREERQRLADKEIEAAKELEQQRSVIRDDLKSQRTNKTFAKPINSPKLFKQVKSGTTKSPLRPIPKLYNPPVVPSKIRHSTYTSYSIDDLGSDDSTDDESDPSKRVPSWAQGMELRTHLMQQFYSNINPDDIFVNCMEPCRLEKIFQKNKERYFRRTSSAHWDSPMIKKIYW